jgi:hypothetical protein
MSDREDDDSAWCNVKIETVENVRQKTNLILKY